MCDVTGILQITNTSTTNMTQEMKWGGEISREMLINVVDCLIIAIMTLKLSISWGLRSSWGEWSLGYTSGYQPLLPDH